MNVGLGLQRKHAYESLMEKVMDKGMRFNKGKVRWSLVPQSALKPMVEVLEFGASKYAPFNWQKGLSMNEILESMKRHLDELMEGRDHDVESTLHHIGHIQCNAMFYEWMRQNKPELDDRFKGHNADVN